MAQAPLRWGTCAWADPVWWAEQQLKVMTATATYLTRVAQAFTGTSGRLEQNTTQALATRADTVPAVVDAPPAPAPAIRQEMVPAVPEEQVPAGPDDELPVARWDELSLGSIRARLSRLSEADLAQLLQYEQRHGARPDVVSMLTNRLTKIRLGGDTAAE
jgi:hypothetical protein